MDAYSRIKIYETHPDWDGVRARICQLHEEGMSINDISDTVHVLSSVVSYVIKN